MLQLYILCNVYIILILTVVSVLVLCHRPLFRKFSQELDTTADFVIYKAESSRMCEEEIVKQLQDLRRCVLFSFVSLISLIFMRGMAWHGMGQLEWLHQHGHCHQCF